MPTRYTVDIGFDKANLNKETLKDPMKKKKARFQVQSTLNIERLDIGRFTNEAQLNFSNAPKVLVSRNSRCYTSLHLITVGIWNLDESGFQREVGLEMVWILNGIWTNGCHFVKTILNPDKTMVVTIAIARPLENILTHVLEVSSRIKFPTKLTSFHLYELYIWSLGNTTSIKIQWSLSYFDY